MSYQISSKLGIIACPGSEKFANEIIEHLKAIQKRDFKRKISLLTEKYNKSAEEITQDINFIHDAVSHSDFINNDPGTYKSTEFNIPVKYTRFANGEFKTEITQTVRGMDIFIVQDVENHYPVEFNDSKFKQCLSVNDHVIMLFVTIDAVMQAAANSVTLILPSYPFSRQHRKKSREALTASWFGRTLEYMGVERIITLEIHSKEIENTFNHLRLENLHASYQIIKKLSTMVDINNDDFVVVSPDTGAVDRNKFYANNLRKPLALIYKERDYSKVTENAEDNNITTMKLLGSVQGKDVFMADDLIGTGGTLLKAMRFLKKNGAARIISAASLPLFTGDAIKYFDEAFQEGLFYRIIGTNAVFHDEKFLAKEWYESTSVSSLFARIISRLHNNRSLTKLLDNSKIIQSLFDKSSE